MREKYLSEYRKLFVSGSVQGSVMRQSENSVGNYIYNSRNIHVGFDIQDSENVKYAYDCSDVRDCMDIFSVYEAEYSYDSYSASM